MANARDEAKASQIHDGLSFGRAVGQHFGLKKNVMDVKVNDARNEVFGVTITVALTPEDVEAIGRLMAQARA